MRSQDNVKIPSIFIISPGENLGIIHVELLALFICPATEIVELLTRFGLNPPGKTESGNVFTDAISSIY